MIINVERTVKMTRDEFTDLNDTAAFSVEWDGNIHPLRYPTWHVNSIHGKFATVSIRGNIHVT